MIWLNKRFFFTTIAMVLILGTQRPTPGDTAAPADLLKRRATKSLLSRKEETRLWAVAELNRKHANDPVTAEILVNVIPKLPNIGKTRESTLKMIWLLRHFNQPDVIEMLCSRLDPKANPEDTLAVLSTLSVLKSASSLTSITQLAESDYFENSHAFRKAVIDTVIMVADARSITGTDFLIKVLPRLKGQTRFEVVRYLCHISKQRFGNHVEMWTTWWADNRDDFKFVHHNNTLRIGGMDVPNNFNWGEVPRFYNIAIYASRVVFLIDAGGHSSNRNQSQPTFDEARRQLSLAIEALPEETYFSIIFVGTKLSVWRGTPSIASSENKENALEFVNQQPLQAGRNTYAGFKKAFLIDNNCEVIYFVGFGRPTVGEMLNPHDIQQAVFFTNRSRRISIHTIAVDVADMNYERFMNQLARGTQGMYRPFRSKIIKQ